MDLLKRFLFLLMLIGLIGGEMLRWDNGQGVGITFLDIGVAIFVCLSLLLNVFQKKKLVFHSQKWQFRFVGIGLASLFIAAIDLKSYQAMVAFLYALRYIFYTVGIYFAVQLLDKKWKEKIPYLLFSGSTILALIGFAQYLWYPELRNLYYAGWDPHLYRIFSTFLDPNFMGLLYACGVIVGVYLTVNKQKTENRKIKVSLGLVTILNLIALFLTYSRGAYLALLAGMCVILWRSGYRRFIFALSVGLLLIIIGIQIFSPRSEGTKLFRSASIRDRVVSLQQVTVIISHYPLFGVGFDAYRYAQDKEGFLRGKVDATHSGAGTDNSFLFVFATTGIFGFIAYLFATGKILKESYLSKTLVGKTLFATYTALIVGSFFVNALFFPFILIWVWILISLE